MADPLFMYKLQNGLLGTPSNYGGLLADEEVKRSRQQGLLGFGASLLQASGPTPVPTGLGQALGGAMMQGNQAQQQYGEQALKAVLMKKQLETSAGKTPSAIQEYEYAKANGFKGTFEEWKRVASAQPQSPSSIQEYEYFNKLTPEQQKNFLSLQRSPVVPQVVMVKGVPTLVDRTGATPPNPLSTQDAEIEALRRKAEAEAEAKAKGTAGGEIWANIQKKGATADVVNRTLDIADPLIDVATGSAGGSAVDKVAGFFGGSPDGATAIGQLKVLQAGLMLNMPRMEGPQSDRDVQLYREAAASLGDPTVPRAIKKAAIKTIRRLQDQYKEAAEKTNPNDVGPPKSMSSKERAKAMGL